MGKKAKPIPETPEEKALVRAQLLTLSKQDEEIQARKRRIVQGQYGSFASKLKTGKAVGASGLAFGSTGGRKGFTNPGSGGKIQ